MTQIPNRGVFAQLATVISTSLILAASPIEEVDAQANSYRPSQSSNATSRTATHSGADKNTADKPYTATDWWNGSWGTGDWFGMRPRLIENGVTITGSYVNNILANVSGGKKLGFAYADEFHLQVALDLDKLAGWKGGNFVVSAIDRNGISMSQHFTGNLYNPNQIYGSQTLRLFRLYLEQKFFNDSLSIKAGRIGGFDDFVASPIYGLYVSNSVDGRPKAVVFNSYMVNWPVTTWGGRIRIDDKKHKLYAMGGVYQTSLRAAMPKYHGADFSIRPEDGMVFVGEVGWTPEFQPNPISSKDKPSNEKWHGMPGNYKFGAYYTAWKDIPTYDGTKADGTYGFYWLADQMVYQAKPGSDAGLTLWTALLFSPDHRTAKIPFQFTGGAFYTGLIPGRSKDQTAIQLTYGSFSRSFANTEQSLGRGNPTNEIVLEATYTFRVTKFLRVQPDVQYIINPNGTGKIPNALVVGAQIGFNF